MSMYDLLRFGQLANLRRTKEQMQSGIGAQSGVQHSAACRLCYLYGDARQFPEFFGGKFDIGWRMSHDEYIQHLQRYPKENLLITWKGVEKVATYPNDWWSLDGALQAIYGQCFRAAQEQATQREMQSERQLQKNYAAKRKAAADANVAKASVPKVTTSATASTPAGVTAEPKASTPASSETQSAPSSSSTQRPTWWKGKWWLMDSSGRWIERPKPAR